MFSFVPFPYYLLFSIHFPLLVLCIVCLLAQLLLISLNLLPKSWVHSLLSSHNPSSTCFNHVGTMLKQGPPPYANDEFSLKQTKPNITATNKPSTGPFNLVEQMPYLYVRVIKAANLFTGGPKGPINGGCHPYVEVRLGNYKGHTAIHPPNPNPEWNQVFAFAKDRIHSSLVEISVRWKVGDNENDHQSGGRVVMDINEVPKRVPPDSPLAPQWYRLEGRLQGQLSAGDLMVAVWMGTQADEAFPDAWQSDASGVTGEGVVNTKSKVYVSPKLWYLRVNVIQAHDLEVRDRSRRPEAYVKAALGSVIVRSRVSMSRSSSNPAWNEDLMFVVAEPFEDFLLLNVQDKLGNKDEVLAACVIPLHTVERRIVDKPVEARWYHLERPPVPNQSDLAPRQNDQRFTSKIQLRVSLDGGYHVLDESTHCSSDLRPTVRQLWKPEIGVLELGILSATGLLPMKKVEDGGTTDAYCVAKYGQKWIRTRTIVDSCSPQWNEQYTWEVFDPCTVITIAVFDNCHLHGNAGARDSRIGKIKIRLSTLETDRIYTHSYPLLFLSNRGVKKMGEIQLAIRFSCSSFLNLMQTYGQPILPRMHYLHPLSYFEIGYLRHQATQVVSFRLARTEPPLRKEVVEYMLDVGSNYWSTRRGKANYQRVKQVFSGVAFIFRWFDDICKWEKPFLTIIAHVVSLLAVSYPQKILASCFLSLFVVGARNYSKRSRDPLHMDVQLSYADKVRPDELDEEFDTVPSSSSVDVIKMRYERLRSIGGRAQLVVGDLATQGERLQALLNWRDPRASALFVMFCLIAGVALFFTPCSLLASCYVFYVLRHPKFRSRLPTPLLNFFRRLPAKTDCLL